VVVEPDDPEPDDPDDPEPDDPEDPEPDDPDDPDDPTEATLAVPDPLDGPRTPTPAPTKGDLGDVRPAKDRLTGTISTAARFQRSLVGALSEIVVT
jgi:hypothetical protein